MDAPVMLFGPGVIIETSKKVANGRKLIFEIIRTIIDAKSVDHVE